MGHQTARVNRPKRHTGTDGSVDRGVELRLVVCAIQPQTAGEVDQRLLLAELPQHFGGGFERRQLAVGVEDVELAVVLTESGSGIGRAGVVRGFIRSLAFSYNQRCDDAQQPVTLTCEIQEYIDSAARIPKDGDQIR